ncbi:MAG: pyridoxal phosphate-dependent aminotransferase [Candidatus Omnitrophica bacterium]|nr:pyridoxal phosphate-dependent aminotransferase [Candidatus Omnitrophota bacterium]
MNHKFTFAQRTQWPLKTNRIVTAFGHIKRQNKEIIDLTISNPTQCGFHYSLDNILSPLSNKRNLFYHPSPKGHKVAREVICRNYNACGLGLSPEQIFLTSSTSEAYMYLFRLLVNPNEKVLFPRPSYPLFPFLCDLNDVNMDYYSIKYDQGEWMIDVESIKHFQDEHLRAVVLVNPNNPTGSYVKINEMTTLTHFCGQQGISIISDEVFWDFQLAPLDGITRMALNRDVLTFSLGGLSKSLILPQMKLAWIIVTGPDDLVQKSIERLEVIADTYLSVNAPAQNALSAWMTIKDQMQEEVLLRLQNNYNYLCQELNSSMDFNVLPVEGGWSAIIQMPGVIEEELVVLKLLNDDYVYVHPGYFFDLDDGSYLTVSLLLPEELFQKGINLIHRTLANLLKQFNHDEKGDRYV